jgi:hypothetical protein
MLVVCYERTSSLFCWKSPNPFGCILKLVGLLEILLFIYVDVVFVYDNLVDVEVEILGIVNCLCWFDVDVVFVYDKLV